MALLADVTVGDEIDPVWGNAVRNQSIQICTNATRPAVPTEGMTVWETDTNVLRIYDGSAWQAVVGYGTRSAWSAVVTQSVTRAGTLSFAEYTSIGLRVEAQMRYVCSVTGSTNTISISYPGGLTPADAANNILIGTATHYNTATTAHYIAFGTSGGINLYGSGASAPVNTALASGHIICLNLNYFI